MANKKIAEKPSEEAAAVKGAGCSFCAAVQGSRLWQSLASCCRTKEARSATATAAAIGTLNKQSPVDPLPPTGLGRVWSALGIGAKNNAKEEHKVDGTRETIESVVVAFVLAFLFRTFVAEPFMIPTGSMAPTLMGRHKDLVCEKCGYPYRVNASQEVDEEGRLYYERPNVQSFWVKSCECPQCRWTMNLGDPQPEAESRFRMLDRDRDGSLTAAEHGEHSPMIDEFREMDRDGDRRVSLEEFLAWQPLQREPSFKGDRILVGKFPYSLEEPERFNVVVFKFPKEAQKNFIKRLTGLPGESLRIISGDLFVKRPGDAAFQVARKSSRPKVEALLQTVYDNDYVLPSMIEMGWPARWRPYSVALPELLPQIKLGARPSNGPQTAADWQTEEGYRSFATSGPSDRIAWLRYEHTPPGPGDWESLLAGRPQAPRLLRIEDFNAYNEGRMNQHNRPSRNDPQWVGDLVVQCDLEVQSAGGEAIFELVKGGVVFHCRIDVASGKAKLSSAALPDFSPEGDSGIRGQGKYRVSFGHVNDELFLWVDDRVVAFDSPATYDSQSLKNWTPQIADYLPVAIGSQGAKLRVDRLKLSRDIFYIVNVSDSEMHEARALTSEEGFTLGKDQFFVMGDNSAQSLDSRFWGVVDRELLIGKAIFVYWPHSWNKIPGTSVWFPMFPNFERMKLVR